MALIELKKIIKTYVTEAGETTAVAGIDLTIEPGEFVSIMGPSGSGKSTLMHMLGLLDRPTSGEFLFHGRQVGTLSDDELAQARNEEIGFVFQAFNLLPKTSVYENVELPLLYNARAPRDKARAIEEVLASVGMIHRRDFSSNQLSGGEKQRVAIARALINKPEILFADEPTGNLDSKSGKQVMQILQRLNDEGVTVVLVTHERNTALHGKRMIRMEDGLIVDDQKITERVIATQEVELEK
jgi:putative ABC transport system ATP-binding protein